MSFLLDTDTCSVHLKRPAGLTSRLVQHAGRLHVSIITVKPPMLSPRLYLVVRGHNCMKRRAIPPAMIEIFCLAIIAYATLKTAAVVSKGMNEIITALQAINDLADKN